MHTVHAERKCRSNIATDEEMLFAVYGLYRDGADATSIAAALQRPMDEMQAAIDCIVAHKPEVAAEYEKYLARPQFAVATGAIHDRGRGPEIKGTRITVYDVLDYYLPGLHHSVIASILRQPPGHILTAIQYINAHWAEIMPAYRRGREHAWRGNSPEIEARLAHSRRKLQTLLRVRGATALLKRLDALERRQSPETSHAQHSGGR
ncbi:MAG: hypothetical protein NTW87_07465 [Planctomycetota bacterium]|nr:hypothetical protein [Planctomycetota bacterium]